MAQLKCIKKNNSRKYYYSIITKWNGVKQETIALISLNSNNKITAITRHQKVLKKEADIKAGLDYTFSWQKENGGQTEIRIQKISESIKEFIEYQHNIRGVRAKTLDLYREALSLLVQAIHDIPTANLSLQHIDEFIRFLKAYKKRDGNPIKQGTINNRIRNVRTFKNWLYERDMIEKNVKIKELIKDNSKSKYISEPIFNKIMDMDIHPRVKRMWKLHWETGMRLRESFIGSINGEWYDIPPDGAKTHQERSIQLNQEQIETIQIVQEHWQEKPTIDRIKWYSKKFKRALKAAGINDRYFHGLRHSFGVRRIHETNGNLTQVRDEMGHKYATQTEDYSRIPANRVKQDFPSLFT